jgi:hypothetical protein
MLSNMFVCMLVGIDTVSEEYEHKKGMLVVHTLREKRM